MPRPRASAPSSARRPPQEVRIIGGLWKRTRLAVADKPGLRPTSDRVRETLFNWLGQDLDGWRCVDVFAGTGALGLEAASRGAAQVLLVEQDPDLVAALRAVKARLAADAVEVRRANGLSVLKDLAGTGQDLVFLDPPFDADLFDKAVAAAVPALAEEGRLYLEAPTAWSEAAAAAHGLVLQRHVKAGAVHAHLLGRAPAAAA
ncbi:MAG TPA: 16S rRNA (guanine(966)-N(2))-methyltransferase RsmD [Ramlibacter sp.]|jgi:16S rRNA (guanine(966)-N(2))-methyltransferase RsmD|uniref:16S rRNA (guanine(966)-N(2))-methyltransferase RsmD n=1 Tax=Ramlibacter sp. TaxID=1917967 RepID=UPI002D4040FA|nr:16S rRNA (guanine(966)-N(2))-methyltransferase RsmD [Ramlibacter sp.]HZY19918.1 16S rRNA (guanine(966)-N(2))-methyltransferase RsmD [Ramlibacter sp.]